jgi:hypothetical protein
VLLAVHHLLPFGQLHTIVSLSSGCVQQKTNIINKLQEEVDVLKRKRDDLHSEESASTKGREESVRRVCLKLWLAERTI